MRLFQSIQSPGWRGNLLAFILGLTMVLGFAPFNLWPIPLLALCAVHILTHTLSSTQTFIRAYSFSFGWFLAGISWIYVSIHRFGNAPVVLAAFLMGLLIAFMALYPALAFYLNRKLRLTNRQLCFIALPTTFLAFELLRATVLTGFPWLLMGYVHTQSSLSPFAPVVGVYGLSWISFLLVGAITFCLLERRVSRLSVAVVGGIFIVSVILSFQSFVQEKGRPMSVSMIQASIPQERKWLAEERLPTINLYQEMTREEWGRDIILWPEAALPVLQNKITGFLSQLDRHAEKMGSALVMGIPAYEPDEKKYHNRVITLGEHDTKYDKQHLVPFGEYVPLESLLRGLIEFFDLPMSRFSSGGDDQMAMNIGKATLAPAICYEIAYPEIVRQMAMMENGKVADILLTVSNDAWFGDSIGPVQHFQIAQMRALEIGRPLLRSTNNGMTGIIDHNGQITHALPQFSREVLQGEVELVMGTTPYVIWGHWLAQALLLLGVLVLFVILYRARFSSSS